MWRRFTINIVNLSACTLPQTNIPEKKMIYLKLIFPHEGNSYEIDIRT